MGNQQLNQACKGLAENLEERNEYKRLMKLKNDIEEDKEARSKLDNNEVIKDYYRSHAQVRNLCQESFDNLSELLGMDLSQYVSGGGGCC